MAETEEPSPRSPLIGQLFYLLTARLEDGAGDAAQGQSPQTTRQATIDIANRLHALGREVMILADAVITIEGTTNPPKV